MSEPRPIKIAIMALGGQGGGVLANWIVSLGERTGYIAQMTSVPGVAQRTGATIYYVELFPEAAAKEKGKTPVLALMPAPGDVDIVIAAELMEAGRAVMRSLVSEQTLVIASTHREYAIAEKIAMSDGRQAPGNIIGAVKKSAGRFIEADFAEAAASEGANISASLFGALAGSGGLNASRIAYEDAIREGGRAVDQNLKAFEKGLKIASSAPTPAPIRTKAANPDAAPSPKVTSLLERMQEKFPSSVHNIIKEGMKRVVDYQDVRYGHDYLDRLEHVLVMDDASQSWRLTQTVAKHLALWMSYEDGIRIADLKTRGARFQRFREDVKAAPDQIVNVSEYLHPRVEEICDLLPPWLASFILTSPARKKAIGALTGARRAPTTKLRGFLPLYFLASLRWIRRGSYRFKLEQGRIAEWLSLIKTEAVEDYALACEIAALQGLIKGYGDTHERGLGNYHRILSALDIVRQQDNPAGVLKDLRDSAFADEEGVALRVALRKLSQETALSFESQSAAE